MNSVPALYVGHVWHRRFTPRQHKLRYRVFWLLLDVDEFAAASRALRLLSFNRFNLFSIRGRDFGDGTGAPLRDYVEGHMRDAGLLPDGGPIRLFTMPRILGYAFNPLSVYFCYTCDGHLQTLLYEVSNTFGERHSYLIPVGKDANLIQQAAPKRFYVSPFLEMALSYTFHVSPPDDAIAISIDCSNASGRVLSASLSGQRRALTDSALAQVFLTHPLLTLKVICGIHWEALRLWLKGVRLQKRPPPPAQPVTAVPRHH